MSDGNGSSPAPLLRLEDVDTYYGPIHILQGLTLEVNEGELVCLIGATYVTDLAGGGTPLRLA